MATDYVYWAVETVIISSKQFAVLPIVLKPWGSLAIMKLLIVTQPFTENLDNSRSNHVS